MGQVQSQYQLPSGKRYIISYCKQYTNNSKIKESINLEKFIDSKLKTNLDLIYNVFYYKLNSIGYNIPHVYGFFQNINTSLESVIKMVNIKSSNRDILSDLNIKYICYFGTINNIQCLLSKGSVLIAGIIIDSEFSEFLLKKPLTGIVTDIILLTGYSEHSFFIKTIWTPEILEIPNKYIENVKEIWDIIINSPEL